MGPFLQSYATNRDATNQIIRNVAIEDSNLINFMNSLIEHDEAEREAATI